MSNVYPGYRGLADISGGEAGDIGYVRFGDASISAKQTINAPDMIMGDWDHDAYVYGPIEVGGSIGGPVTETFATTQNNSIWDWAVKRYGNCGTLKPNNIKLYYYCGDGSSGNNARTFTDMYVNSVNFSCAAGDIANFSLDLMGRLAGDWENATAPLHSAAEKLITWDKVSVVILSNGGEYSDPPYELAFSNFDFNISNNLQVVYSLGQDDLFPYAIVPGLRTISGSISVYNAPDFHGFDSWNQIAEGYSAENTSTIRFGVGDLSINMRVRFHRVEPTSSTGPITSTVGFTGVGHQSGTEWIGA